jgi:DNA-binding ferritin-like protein (Dps family)
MTTESEHFQYSPIWNHPYERWFREVQYNGKVLNTIERKEFVKVVDETILDFSEGLPLLKEILEQIKDLHDEYHNAYRVIISVIQSTVITMIDNMVVGKYFILADKDYDRRFMRGKMKVILNEGFKKLYGFDEKSHKKSEWNRLAPILKYFPEDIQNQYKQLSSLLEEHSMSSSWWKDERNVETHLDIEKLYESRCEEVVESKVMMDSLKLYNTLYAVNLFLTNAHSCFYNYLLTKYKQGELKEK